MSECPVCFTKLNFRGTGCCDACADKRRAELREKERLALEVGRQSSLNENSLKQIYHPRHNRDCPGLRTDARWYIEKGIN